MAQAQYLLGGGLMAEFPMAQRAQELSGEMVHIVSSDSGPLIGHNNGTLFRPEIRILYASHQSRHVHFANLVSIAPVEYVSGTSDGSSHGANWENFSRTVETAIDQERNLRRATSGAMYRDQLLDGCVSMAAEGSHQIDSGWSAIFEYLLNVQKTPFHYYLHQQLRGLRHVADTFAKREKKEIQDFIKDNESLPSQ